MIRVRALSACCVLAIAGCGGGDSDSTDSVAPPETETVPPETAPPETDAPAPDTVATEPAPTDPPATDPDDVTVATESPSTSAAETSSTTEPPAPLDAVGLVPLPGAQLDFSGRPVATQSLIWSLYSGSGGVIVENLGGPIPPGCHGTSFFDPDNFDLLQVDGADAEAYAELGALSCDGMVLPDGLVVGDAVAVNEDDLIVFDFGTLPPGPFDVSTQVVDPGGSSGTFRAGDPRTDQNTVNELTDASHVVGATGIFARDPSTGRLSRLGQPVAAEGAGCAESTVCLQNGRFQVEVVDALGSPGLVNVSDETGAAFVFTDEARIEVVMSVLNACGVNDHFWVFAASAYNVEFTLTVTDTLDDSTQSYVHPLGEPSEAVVDTAAFATCP